MNSRYLEAALYDALVVWGLINYTMFILQLSHVLSEWMVDIPWRMTAWWFQICFIVHNIWDNPSHWLSYFSRWLKPPTRWTFREPRLNRGGFQGGHSWWSQRTGFHTSSCQTIWAQSRMVQTRNDQSVSCKHLFMFHMFYLHLHSVHDKGVYIYIYVHLCTYICIIHIHIHIH